MIKVELQLTIEFYNIMFFLNFIVAIKTNKNVYPFKGTKISMVILRTERSVMSMYKVVARQQKQSENWMFIVIGCMNFWRRIKHNKIFSFKLWRRCGRVIHYKRATIAFNDEYLHCSPANHNIIQNKKNSKFSVSPRSMIMEKIQIIGHRHRPRRKLL